MERRKIKVLLLPKFEPGTVEDETIGEAKLFYEKYFREAERIVIPGCPEVLYVQGELAMILTGEGKANAGMTTALVLGDTRFDFSECWILGVGCCGSAIRTTVMGDVFLITATADYELGHQADVRDLRDPSEKTTWFHDASFDPFSHFVLNQRVMENVYEWIRSVPLFTTEKTKHFLGNAFAQEPWTQRNPQVMKGTSITSDNYWKGEYGEANARKIAETYHCPDPYVCSEMEDNAVALAASRFGMLDRLVLLRVSVNTDVFMNGASPEILWDSSVEKEANRLAENEEETADIFVTAMMNLFRTAEVVIHHLLNGSFL